MKKAFIVNSLLGALMVTASVLAWIMTPQMQLIELRVSINLESMIPETFGGWKIERATLARIVNPEDQGLVVKLYDQTLSRTYISETGERVMLSIAYGKNQSTDLHVHRPEICYATGGFEVGKISKTFIDTSIGRIPVMRMVARQGSRIEPITYWIRVGDSLTRGWVEQKVAAIGYGVSRIIPDGLLFRVSTISNDEQHSYEVQQAFVAAMMQTIKSEDRHWLVGQLTQ